ncbi:MAG: hypothetical protein JJU21_03695 [Salinarimonas sp.]|nr:hypothetical protein [Salinarimonas sp.]
MTIVICAALFVALLPAQGSVAQEIDMSVENRRGAPVEFRAGPGFQGRLDDMMPRMIAPGETITRRLIADYPNSQGGGFRYGDGAGRECDFGVLRLRDPGGPWQMPVLRAQAPTGGIGCRAELEGIDPGGDFGIRFIVE